MVGSIVKNFDENDIGSIAATFDEAGILPKRLVSESFRLRSDENQKVRISENVS